MAVTIDAGGSAARKTSNFVSKAANTVAKATKTAVATRTSPTANGAVTARQADFQQRATIVKHNLATTYTATQTPSPQEQADQIVENNGGRNRLDTDNAGRDIAAIAVSDPATANTVSQLVLDQINGNDKDEVSQSFADDLSNSQLREIGKNPQGKEMLERFKDHLLSGSVHSDERATAARLQNGIQGFPLPELTGNHEADIQTVADDLEGLTAAEQADYIDAVLEHPYGIETLQRAAILSADDQKVLAEGLSNAYEADSSGFNKSLQELVESEKMYPVTQWTGFASVIGQSGNDALIASYASKAINFAAANPENNAVNVDAMAALSGMSPDALASFISFRTATPPINASPTALGQASLTYGAQFQSALGDAAGWLSAEANNNGFPNPWAFNPALGNLLDTASKMTTPNGKPTEAALRIFETVATKTGDNFYTKQAAGNFFVEHGQSIVDRFTALRNPDGTTNRNFDPEVLKDFFVGVVYSPISHLLEHDGQPLVEVIMGDGGTNTGVIGDIAQTLMDRSANGGDPEAIGREIGYLFGSISGGFLDSVEAYKDKFNDDKEFRSFMYGIVNKGLGSLGKKAGIPLDKIAGFAEKLYEAGKSRERSDQLRGYQEAFLDLKDQMRFTLLDFERSSPEANGLEESFTIGWTDFITSYLASDWIAR